jgi:hypothetical protein
MMRPSIIPAALTNGEIQHDCYRDRRALFCAAFHSRSSSIFDAPGWIP